MKRPATYVLHAEAECLYVGATEHIGQRLTNHSNKQPWWPEVSSIEVTHYPSIEEARRAEAELIAALNPTYNIVRTYIAPPEWSNTPLSTEFVNVERVAKELFMSKRTIDRWIQQGRIEARRVGSGTKVTYAITVAELQRLKTILVTP